MASKKLSTVALRYQHEYIRQCRERGHEVNGTVREQEAARRAIAWKPVKRTGTSPTQALKAAAKAFARAKASGGVLFDPATHMYVLGGHGTVAATPEAIHRAVMAGAPRPVDLSAASNMRLLPLTGPHSDQTARRARLKHAA